MHYFSFIVLHKPEIISRPIKSTVEIGLPITLTCVVNGDPSHYWVGWLHKNFTIQTGDGHSHSVSTSPTGSLLLPNSTSYHLTVHSVQAPGKYTCQVFNIEGKQLDNVTHQINVKGMYSCP